MIKTPIVLETAFDQETLDQIQELRKARLEVSKKMLADVDLTAYTLKTEGYLDEASDISAKELRVELENRIEMLEDRIKNPSMIHEDELNLFADLIEDAVNA